MTLITMKSILILSLLIALTNSRENIKTVSVIDNLRHELLSTEKELWEDVIAVHSNKISMTVLPEIELIRFYKNFDDKIQSLYTHDVDYGLKSLENVWVWARTYSELRGIYALYQAFKRFQRTELQEHDIPSPKQAWLDLAHTILNDPRNGIPKASERIHELILKDKLFENALKEANSELCNLNQSPHQLLYNLYNSIALTELKGYAMTQFSYMLLKLYDKGNFTQEAELMSNRYKERAEQTIGAVKRAMEGASRQLWNCDPKHYEEGKNYEQLTELLQGYIENEVDMNDAGTCRENCAAYTYTHSYGCFKDLYCSRQRRCNGKIINCRFVDSDMWICPGNDNSHRRYEYIEYENSRTLGRKLNCAKGVTKVDSWWRWLFWHCSYCLCLCDEQSSTSDRFFNLRNVFANHTANKVVTGLRFVKVNRVIHLQIQQGELLPRGNIAQNTLQWVPVDDYKITDRNVYNGQDYHTMTWNERAIDLDDLVVPAGHILTGVRFRRVGSHLNFEVQSCPFNFTTGKLDDPKQLFVWTSNDNTDANMETPRKKLMLQSPDIPTRSPLPSAPDSQSDQFMHFTHTDIDKDAAQTTVPFLDSQPVVSQIAVPLSGAGIYHKGQLGFGGFLAPKIITYDFGAHLKPAFPQEDIVN